MPLHDCPHSFNEIALQILPALMARLKEQMAVACSATQVTQNPDFIPNTRGAYVWIVQGKPIYVGIANNLRRRIKDHLCTDASRANLAVRMAAKYLGVPISRVKRHSDFEAAFSAVRVGLANAQFAFIEIDNPLILYFFEPYCAMQLDTSEFNRFDTLQILAPRPVRPPSMPSQSS